MPWPVSDKKSCCSDKCEMKDGKCADMEKCKTEGCCKDEAACKANGCCGGDHQTGEKWIAVGMANAVNPGHNGKDCCKSLKLTVRNWSDMKRILLIISAVVFSLGWMLNFQRFRCRQQDLPAMCNAINKAPGKCPLLNQFGQILRIPPLVLF